MSKIGLDYPTKWGRSPGIRVVRNLIHSTFLVPYTRYLSTLDVRGLEKIQGDGPFIFVANHTSNMDTPLVIAALPGSIRRRLVVAAAMDNFFMESGRAFRTVLVFNAIPIDRHKVNRRSAQIAFDLVEADWNLLIYPEGGRSPDGELHEFKGGAAYLAERSMKTVIPMYIHESGWLQGPKYAKAAKFASAPDQHRHHVIVAFGDAMLVEEGENIRRFNNRIVDAVEQLGREVSGDATLRRQARPRVSRAQHAAALCVERVGDRRRAVRVRRTEDRGQDLVAEPGVHREHRAVRVRGPDVLRAVAVERAVVAPSLDDGARAA